MHSERTPFASQKDSFCSLKVPLLQCKRTTFVEADFSIRSENKDVPLPRKAEGTWNQKNSHYFRSAHCLNSTKLSVLVVSTLTVLVDVESFLFNAAAYAHSDGLVYQYI